LATASNLAAALLEVAPDYPAKIIFVTTFLPEPNVPHNIMFVNMGYFGAPTARVSWLRSFRIRTGGGLSEATTIQPAADEKSLRSPGRSTRFLEFEHSP